MGDITSLEKQGWHMTEGGVKKLSSGKKLSEADIIKTALDTDIKDYGRGHIPENWSKKSTVSIEGVLQVQKIRNVAAPKANEESQGAPRLLRVTLSDGTNTVTALEMGQQWSRLSLRTPPGTKLRLRQPVPVCCGFLLVPDGALHLLGGTVQLLVDKWLMAKAFASQDLRPATGGAGGPPPWVPFGRNISAAHKAEQNFKSLAGGEEAPVDAEFEAQRRAQIAQLANTGRKQFGGGTKQMTDGNLQTLMGAGFSQEESEAALKYTYNDVGRALQNLQRFRARQDGREGADGDTGRGRGGRGGRGRGRGGREDDSRGGRRGRGRYEDEEEGSGRPSEPVTLLDFVGVKIAADSHAAPSDRRPPPSDGDSSAPSGPAGRRPDSGGGRDGGGRGGRGGRGGGQRVHTGSEEFVEGRRARNRRQAAAGGPGGYQNSGGGYQNSSGGYDGYRDDPQQFPELPGPETEGGQRAEEGQRSPERARAGAAAATPAARHQYTEGEMCLARYWQDKQMYLVRVVSCGDRTCVVNFVDYGEHYEEVLSSNMRPLGFESEADEPKPGGREERRRQEPHQSQYEPSETSSLFSHDRRSASRRQPADQHGYGPSPTRNGGREDSYADGGATYRDGSGATYRDGPRGGATGHRGGRGGGGGRGRGQYDRPPRNGYQDRGRGQDQYEDVPPRQRYQDRGRGQDQYDDVPPRHGYQSRGRGQDQYDDVPPRQGYQGRGGGRDQYNDGPPRQGYQGRGRGQDQYDDVPPRQGYQDRGGGRDQYNDGPPRQGYQGRGRGQDQLDDRRPRQGYGGGGRGQRQFEENGGGGGRGQRRYEDDSGFRGGPRGGGRGQRQWMDSAPAARGRGRAPPPESADDRPFRGTMEFRRGGRRPFVSRGGRGS